MELLTTVVWFFVFFLGFKIMLAYFKDTAEAEIAQRRLLEHADTMIRIVKLEPLPEQDTILAYDLEDNQFLGQGSDEDEVKQSIMKRFPEKLFVLNNKPFSANKLIEARIEKSKAR